MHLCVNWMSRNLKTTSDGGSLGSLVAPSPLAVLSSAVTPWHKASTPQHNHQCQGAAAPLPLLAQLSSHTRPPCKPSTELAQFKNDRLKTLLEQVCWFLHPIHRTAVPQEEICLSGTVGRDGVVRKRKKGGHQLFRLVLPPRTVSYKATKSWSNF